MDVVYVVRNGQRNEELRYSLRSLANLPHDRVWIAGYKPKWVAGVAHIPVRQDRPSKYRNATANIRAACEAAAVSDEFYWFNDDFFVVEPVDEVPIFHRGPVDEVVTLYPDGPYAAGMRATAALLADLGHPAPVSYELHIPLRVTKADLLETLALRARRGLLHTRTLYGNLHSIGGVQVGDVKVTALDQPLPDGPFASTDDRSFSDGLVGEQIRGLFPDPGPYEVA